MLPSDKVVGGSPVNAVGGDTRVKVVGIVSIIQRLTRRSPIRYQEEPEE
jgi:hypothetical protein